jgi:ubiquitin carboxyl-terminal hydrolase 22/27/51
MKGECDCIIHRVFSGKFQSVVTCFNCENETFVNDPFLDVSLDVRPVFSPVIQAAVSAQIFASNVPQPTKPATPTQPIVSNTATMANPSAHGNKIFVKSSSASNTPVKINTSDLPFETHSLYECLDRFTHRESLRGTEYKCSKCNNLPTNGNSQNLGAFKQLSFKSLPLVLSLQLKRYEHTLFKTQVEIGSKLSMLVRFPLELDLFPYTTLAVHHEVETARKNYLYVLFAVIVHSGTLNSGHYLCYVRKSGTDKWIRFDDDFLSIVEWDEVRKSQAYMLFYIKKHFEYFA